MSFDDIWESGQYIDQTIFKEEAELLYKEVINLPLNSTIVEIGSFVGRSTHVLASTAQLVNSQVICIDPFLKSFDGWTHKDPKKVFKENILDKFDNVKLINDYSLKAFRLVKRCQFLFIDGDHSEKGIKTDCRLYLTKLDDNCTVAFHDYWNLESFPAIKKVVDSVCVDWQIVSNAFSVQVRRKPC